MPKNVSRRAENENAFKHLFNKALLSRMSKALKKSYPPFDSAAFQKLMPELEKLEMKPRVLRIRDELSRQLPTNFPKALKILIASVQEEKLHGFALWPYTEFIQTYGLDDIQLSLNGLKKLTPLFTAEFAVRPFLRQHPEKTLNYLLKCATNKDVHVRRWASEGTRPRLPWGERLQEFVKNPSEVLPILELLKWDDELYVRKSVSNHLSDIAKDHPEKVVQLLLAWKKSSSSENLPKVEWIIRRALRNLIKAGHAGALKLIGVSTKAAMDIKSFQINGQDFKLEDRLEFAFQIHSHSTKPQNLVIDYVIHFVKANRSTSPKVFKLKTTTLEAGEKLKISKIHHLKPVTTRVYHPGIHHLEIQVNGRIVHRVSWNLRVPTR